MLKYKLHRLLQTYRHNRCHALLGHGDSVHDVGGAHGALVVRDHNELRAVAELADNVVELVDIGIV